VSLTELRPFQRSRVQCGLIEIGQFALGQLWG
jgi:hypothetical protein